MCNQGIMLNLHKKTREMIKMKNRSLLKNTIYNALYNGLNIIFPLITIPYLSRILLSDGLGLVNYSRSIVSWFLIFASLGIPRYGVREIAKIKDNRDKLDKTFTELFLYNLLSTCICVAIYMLVISQVSLFSNHYLLYMVTGIQLFLNILNVDYLYQGLEEYVYITKRSFVVKAISLLCMFIFVKEKQDYIIYALIQSLAVAGNYVFNFIHLKKHVHFSAENLELMKHTKPIIILLSTQLAISLYSLLDTTMLGWWCSNSVIGYYTNVQKIIITISTITASLGGVMLPRLVFLWNHSELDAVKKLGSKALELIIVICIPASIGIFALAPQIVRLIFGMDFLPCILTLKIFAPFVLISTVGNLYGTQLLMTFDEEKILLITVSVGALLNMSLNLFLIPKMEQNGATIASVVTEAIVLCLQIYFVNKQVKLKCRLHFLKTLFIMTTVMILYLMIIVNFLDDDISVIVCSIFGSGCIYLILGILLKNEAILYFVGLIKSKILSRKKIDV